MLKGYNYETICMKKVTHWMDISPCTAVIMKNFLTLTCECVAVETKLSS